MTDRDPNVVLECDHCGQRFLDRAAAATHLLDNHAIVDKHVTVYDGENVPRPPQEVDRR